MAKSDRYEPEFISGVDHHRPSVRQEGTAALAVGGIGAGDTLRLVRLSVSSHRVRG